jgi:hypothetical protein
VDLIWLSRISFVYSQHNKKIIKVMKNLDVVEGNLRAVKCSSDFGGPNMWDLYIKTVDGSYNKVQWMGVQRIQELFTTKLPVF